MNEEAIELLEKAVLDEATLYPEVIKIRVNGEMFYQALALLRQRPKCKTCEGSGIKKPDGGCGDCLAIDGNCRTDCPCPDCQQPEPSEFTESARKALQICRNCESDLPNVLQDLSDLGIELCKRLDQANANLEYKDETIRCYRVQNQKQHTELQAKDDRITNAIERLDSYFVIYPQDRNQQDVLISQAKKILKER